MKKNIILAIIATVATLALNSCMVVHDSDEDYFGYTPSRPTRHVYQNTNTVAPSQAQADSTNPSGAAKGDSKWVNPLGKNNNQSVQDSQDSGSGDDTDYYDNNYRYYNAPMYTPVIVPWWDYYYGWGYYYPHRSFYLSVGYNGFWDCGWYSPWYDYNPYFGYYWPSYGFGGYYGWYGRPYYGYNRYNHPIYNGRYYASNSRGIIHTGTGGIVKNSGGSTGGRGIANVGHSGSGINTARTGLVNHSNLASNVNNSFSSRG